LLLAITPWHPQPWMRPWSLLLVSCADCEVVTFADRMVPLRTRYRHRLQSISGEICRSNSQLFFSGYFWSTL
jgi:hypothetical protein